MDTNETLIDFVYSKWERKPSKKVYEYVENLDYTEVVQLAKVVWLTGVFPVSVDKSDSSVYDLYKAIPGPQNDLISAYFSVTDVIPVTVVESSILTMLLRVKDIEDQSVSVYYKKLLLQIQMKVGSNIPTVIRKYASENIIDKELGLLFMLFSLRGR